ncbi:MFS general substrate transporter [Ascoidea rubescens DSM 1968]|uniref:MFS general substrate transporter n=1 Tax=Ascoidea rubescens DSM 1968 TaxID=1344418 RepID=A0A1D2VK06_9ASCO|nr:MFS general substrate transporter [Ascoidea rubescens DSM 1968]ODV61919.1 MFS general substrate transporter [Ascoidea rubescens DSM 1968]
MDEDQNHQRVIRPPQFTSKAIKHYLKTRFTELIPSKEEMKANKHLLNPFKPLTQMTAKQWNFFGIAFWGWTLDAFDYFAVSLNVTNIAHSLDRSTKDITWGITLVLMLRSVGAIIFGYLGDRYGRKWPFIGNLILLSVLQIATGFINTYKQFLGVRSLFGIAMGGVFGNAAATALDDAPADARGVLSGIFQQGYAFGYLLVVIFQRAITDTTAKGWRSLFWFSSGLSVIFIVWRAFLPETDAFIRHKQQTLESTEESSNKRFLIQAKQALKTYWLIMIYLVILMAAFNFMSHGSQDLYPTMLTNQLNFDQNQSTLTNSLANIGAIVGGFFFGWSTNFIGRRFAIIICCIGGGAMIYPWAFVRNDGINAGVLFLQFFVQGAWGTCPLHLSELSPPHFRSFVTGVSYQLGNLASSASSTIEAAIGERFPIFIEGKEDVYDYAKVMAIFMGCVFVFLLVVALFGPENRGADLNAESLID